MGCGGTYFISVQQVIEKSNIRHAKLLLRLNVELESSGGHNCDSCSRILTERECNIIEDLSDPDKVVGLEDNLDSSCKMGLVYVAGYIQRNHDYIGNVEGGSHDYYSKYGAYLNEINRGGLLIPVDSLVQWVFICYFLYLNLDHTNLCRKSLSNYFMEISDIHNFSVLIYHANILSNILLNNMSKLETPRSSKEVGQKALKLS